MNTSADPRQSMAHLPSLLQRPLTWITGKPLRGQTPLFRWNPWSRTFAGLLTLALGVTANLVALAHGGLASFLLLPGFLFTTGGLRALYLEIAHNAVHHAFSRSRALDRFVTELFTTLTLMNGYQVFRREHVRLHHGRNGTLEDPDYRALLAWGFTPGLPLATLRRRAVLALFHPRVHVSYLMARLRANFLEGPGWRRAVAAIWHGGLVGGVALHGAWALLVVGYLLPLVFGFQVSSLLQMLAGEHRWGLDTPSGPARLRALTYGRFLGDPWPKGLDARWTARLRWFARLVFFHLPARVFVFVGNDIGPAHDVHHRRPNFDWPNAAYAREELRARGELQDADDVWGSLVELVDVTLRGMSVRGRSTDAREIAA
ncbi:MAG: fatty acid desaturase [Planctomycetota bacterium]